MVLLVSFAGQEDGSFDDIAMHPRRVYAIVNLQHELDVLRVGSVQTVPYQSVGDILIASLSGLYL